MLISGSRHMTVLVVDDDDGHCELVRRNLRRAGVENTIIILHNGDQALDYVFGRQAFASREMSEELLILLDINMPGGSNGLDVLRQVKAHPVARMIPVIMLTTTDDPKEINRCYDLGCGIYVTKPVDPTEFMEAVKRLGLFISVVSAPTAILRQSADKPLA